MRFVLMLLTACLYLTAADVNKVLYDENNVTAEIQKIRARIALNLSTDEQVQNQLSIQKLFLTKIEKLATTPPEPAQKLYPLPEKQTLSQQEFMDYFSFLAGELNSMLTYKANKPVLHKRLSDVKEQLSALAPNQEHEILQSQLEYAYFKWRDIYNSRALKGIQEYLDSEKSRFLSAFSRTQVNLEKLEKENDEFNKTLQKLYQKKVYLELRLEKEAISLASQKSEDVNSDINTTSLTKVADDSQKNWRFQFVRDELDKVNTQISDQIKAKNHILVLRQVYNLQQGDLEAYIIVRDIMKNFFNDLQPEDQAAFELEQKMLEWLKYEHIGDITAIIYDFKAWSERVYEKTVVFLNAPLFYQNDRPVVLFDFIQMIITVIIGFIIARFYKRRIGSAQNRFTSIDKQSFKIIGNIGYYFIVILTFAISLSNIGLDMSSLSLVAGALSVGIGFGLKEVVGNFVSGIILMVERTVKIGDFVEIENGISGNIIDIRMRSVTIKTPSNIDIVVPNSLLVQQSFTNYTLEEPTRRLSVPFTVAYGVSFEAVKELVMNALHDSDLDYIKESNLHANDVIMLGMDERGVNYALFVYVRTYGPNARSPFFRLIYKTLQENNIPIPSPRLQVKMMDSVD